MELNEYQRLAHDTAMYPGFNATSASLMYPALKLCGEAGEVAEKIGKAIRGQLIFSDESGLFHGFNPAKESEVEAFRQALAKELGDVMWYINELATQLGFTADEVALMNLEKLEKRKIAGTIHGDGDDREEENPTGAQVIGQ